MARRGPRVIGYKRHFHVFLEANVPETDLKGSSGQRLRPGSHRAEDSAVGNRDLSRGISFLRQLMASPTNILKNQIYPLCIDSFTAGSRQDLPPPEPLCVGGRELRVGSTLQGGAIPGSFESLETYLKPS